MLAAHPPGSASGSAVRGAIALAALRARYERVDVVALTLPGEERFADPAATLIARPPGPTAYQRVAMLAHGGPYYWDERAGRLPQRIVELVSDGTLCERYELVWCHATLLAGAARAVAARGRILDIDNVPSADIFATARAARGPARSAWFWGQAMLMRRSERARAGGFDAVCVTSEAERERLGAVRAAVLVLPNSVPERAASAVAASDEQVLFVGSLSYGPNVDAVGWLADEIAGPLRAAVPGARVRVVGRTPSAEVRAACTSAGMQLVADAPLLDEHYHAARLVLAPMRSGGGTGRIKILEAMSYGVPVVATAQAIDGLDLVPGRDVLVADDAAGLARHAAALLRDPAAAARVGEAGRAVWRERHDPAAARRIIDGVIDGVLSAPS